MIDTELVQRAMQAAIDVLNASEHRVDGVVLLVELDGMGVTIACELDEPGRLPLILHEGSLRTRGAMQ